MTLINMIENDLDIIETYLSKFEDHDPTDEDVEMFLRLIDLLDKMHNVVESVERSFERVMKRYGY
jgi:hypothetical protein